MNNLIASHTVDFNNDTLEVFTVSNNVRNEVYVMVRKICENIGLTWQPQHRKIKDHHRFSKGIMMLPTNSKGGEQISLCLQKSKFFMWLYSINPDKVSSEIRPKLIKYQDEVETAIDNYFTQGVAVRSQEHIKETEEIFSMISSQAKMISVLADEMYQNRRRIQDLESNVGKIKEQLYFPKNSSQENNYISSRQAKTLCSLAKQKGGNRRAIMKIWARFKNEFNIDRYVLLPKGDFEGALAWFDSL